MNAWLYCGLAFAWGFDTSSGVLIWLTFSSSLIAWISCVFMLVSPIRREFTSRITSLWRYGKPSLRAESLNSGAFGSLVIRTAVLCDAARVTTIVAPGSASTTFRMLPSHSFLTDASFRSMQDAKSARVHGSLFEP